jgi:hypothetical protein
MLEFSKNGIRGDGKLNLGNLTNCQYAPCGILPIFVTLGSFFILKTGPLTSLR